MIDLLRKSYYKTKRYYQYDRYVLGRTACLGQDLFNLKFNTPAVSKTLINMQKVRVDMFIDFSKNKSRPKAHLIEPFMLRKDVFPMIIQQERFDWLNAGKTSNLIVLDSFSELTDQKFTHINEGWSFCCNYTDLDHSPEFKSNFEYAGLIGIPDLEKAYVNFFDALTKYYKNKEIVFIHFPTMLDAREKFNERGKRILDILFELEKKYKKIKNIHIEDNDVSPSAEDDFPYHFHKNTQLSFLKQWNA